MAIGAGRLATLREQRWGLAQTLRGRITEVASTNDLDDRKARAIKELCLAAEKLAGVERGVFEGLDLTPVAESDGIPDTVSDDTAEQILRLLTVDTPDPASDTASA